MKLQSASIYTRNSPTNNLSKETSLSLSSLTTPTFPHSLTSTIPCHHIPNPPSPSKNHSEEDTRISPITHPTLSNQPSFHLFIFHTPTQTQYTFTPPLPS